MDPNQTPRYEIPTEMRDFAEKSVDQARTAIDGFIGAARKTVDTLDGSATTVQSSAKDATQKTFSYAEQNISAAFELAQKLVRSKDLQEAVQHQAEFVRSQFASMQQQMKDFGAMAQSAVTQGTQAAQGAVNEAAQSARGTMDKAAEATQNASRTASKK